MSAPEPTPGPSSSRKTKATLVSSPMKKRIKRCDMRTNEKTIAVNIYKYIEKNTPTYPKKTEQMKTTAESMGVSVRTINRVINEYVNTGKVSSPDRSSPNNNVIMKLDDFTLSAIRRKVHQFYYNNELPTVNKVLKAVNDDKDLPNFKRTTMFNIMKKLNFNFTKRSRKSILIDREDLIVWRRNYLLQMQNYRKENRRIYYTDETWVNEGHTAKYVWVDDNITNCRQAFLNGLTTGLKNPQKGKRLILTHIGSTEGFLEGGEWIFEAKKTDREGDYHSEMDAHNFEKWFKNILNLVKPGSVIVLDNAPYHSRLAEKVPNMNWRKADIQAWLKNKEITYNENSVKAQLLLKFNKENYKAKVIDEMAAEKNVIVLRLPPYHCELNPIELIWAQIKSHVGRNNKTFKMAEIKELTREGITKIDAASWQKCIEHVIKEEYKMLELDGLMDDAIDNAPTPRFVMHVTSESETSAGDSTDFDEGTL